MAEEEDGGGLDLADLDEVEDAPQPAPKNDEDNDDTIGDAMDMDLPRSAKDLEAVYDIPVQVSAVLGKTTMPVSSLLKLGRGAVVELDRKVGEAIDIYVNNRLVARGEVVVVCLLYTSPSPRDLSTSRMPSSA